MRRESLLLASWIVGILDAVILFGGLLLIMFFCIADPAFWWLVLYVMFTIGAYLTALAYNVKGWLSGNKEYAVIAGGLYILSCLLQLLNPFVVLNIIFTFLGYGNLKRGYNYGM